MAATNESMRHPKVSMILATGGSAMVKAAYRVGHAGPGRRPGQRPRVRGADGRYSEGRVVYHPGRPSTMARSAPRSRRSSRRPDRRSGDGRAAVPGRLLPLPEEIDKVSAVVIRPNGAVEPRRRGPARHRVAEMAGIQVPADTKVLVAPLDGVGPQYPSPGRSSCPRWPSTPPRRRAACERCIELISSAASATAWGSTAAMRRSIMAFAMEKPVFRILVNTPTTHGAVGVATGLARRSRWAAAPGAAAPPRTTSARST